MARLYETMQVDFDLFINEYIIIKNDIGNVIDKFRFDGEKLVKLKQNNLESKQLGKIKPKDEYQVCLVDALLNNYNNNNNIVLVQGRAGSGKSLFCLHYCFHALDKNIIDKIIIIVNPLVTRNAAKMGFYPGSKDEKLLDSFIGNMLISKLGSKIELLRLLDREIELLPVGDIGGYETEKRSILYLPEAQNYSIDLMKLILQRVGDNTKVLIDGDLCSQVDLKEFEGANNGMKRLSEVFHNESLYFEVELKNIYRSKIGLIADKM